MLAVRAVIGLKRALQAVGISPRSADVYVDCVGEWRYPAFLVHALRRCGVRTLEVPLHDAVAAWGADGVRNFVFRTRFVTRSRVTAPVVVARDPGQVGGERRSRVRVSVDWFAADQPATALVMPYFPDRRFWANASAVPTLRSEPRRFRIGFAGSTGDEVYTGQLAFPVLGRQEVLATVRERFSARLIDVDSAACLETVDAAATPIVFATARGKRHLQTAHVLDTREYLTFLGLCDFFLAPPGFMMPVCHNLIEAMALHAIPIVNYSDWVRPPLEDGVSCLAFSTRDELVEVVERALAMDDAELAALRAGVAAFHSDHLSLESFAARLGPALDRSPTIVVNAEKNTVACWLERQGGERC